jgi:hypothetical protein
VPSAAYWTCAVISALSALTSLFFSARAAVTDEGHARTNARYVVARSFPLTVVAVIPLFHHSTQWEIAVALCLVIVQALDAGIGVTIRDRKETAGPALTAALNLAALLWLIS